MAMTANTQWGVRMAWGPRFGNERVTEYRREGFNLLGRVRKVGSGYLADVVYAADVKRGKRHEVSAGTPYAIAPAAFTDAAAALGWCSATFDEALTDDLART